MTPPIPSVGFLAVMALLAAATPPQRTAPSPNAAQQGAEIAAKGAGEGVAPCSSCHGADGAGIAASGFPRIAGQSRSYLVHQLESYANGDRQNAVMQPIAKALSKDQREAVSAYYADLSAASADAGKPAAKKGGGSVARGRTLSEVGDERIAVQGCTNCHGPAGRGMPPAYPYLAGQHASYLKQTLGEWKSGARKTDASGQMNQIAQRLSEADMNSLAAYFAAQPAPQPLESRLARGRPGTPSGARSPSTPQAGGAVPQTGAGTEQGAPTTGGSQGAGGGGAASGSGAQGSRSGDAK